MRPLATIALASILLAGCGFLVPAANQGAPVAAGARECIGLAEAICEDLLESVSSGRNVQPIGWRVRCLDVCDNDSGEAEVSLRFADGRTETSTMGWVGDIGGPGLAPDPPDPRVQQQCLGVPDSECQSEWSTSMENLTPEQRANAVIVIVQCIETCTEARGQGQTTVVLADGQRIPVGEWSYELEPDTP